MMQPGARVRLTKQVANALQARNNRRYPIDWRARRGTLIHVGLHNGMVRVRWDGRTSLDPWPVKAIMEATELGVR